MRRRALAVRHQNLFRDALRFAGAGLVNTIGTVAVYQLLLFTLAAPLAYAITWMIGMAFVVSVYPTQVFKGGDTTKRGRVLVASIYILSFMLGVGAITLSSYVFGNERLGIFITIAVTTTFNFFAMRAVLRS